MPTELLVLIAPVADFFHVDCINDDLTLQPLAGNKFSLFCLFPLDNCFYKTCRNIIVFESSVPLFHLAEIG